MKTTAAFVLRRTTDLVARFRNKPRAPSTAFARSKVKHGRPAVRVSTDVLVRRLVQPVTRRQNHVAF